ncbi:MAG: accessory gene regulator ArgB-like protein [Desulfocucumaceae bacterium]
MKMYDIANRAAFFLASETGLEEKKVDRVRFGLEIIFGEVIKIFILLLTAAILGILPEALAAMAGFTALRLVSGGAHCEDYWRCLAFGLLIELGSGGLGLLAARYLTEPLLVGSIIIGAVVMAVPVAIWAPGEVALKMIKPEERGLSKGLSLAVLALVAGVLAIFITPLSVPVAVAGFLGTAVQVFTLTPPGYRAIEGFDIALSRIIGERRCSTHAENA